jgi:hypothetical protein
MAAVRRSQRRSHAKPPETDYFAVGVVFRIPANREVNTRGVGRWLLLRVAANELIGKTIERAHEILQRISCDKGQFRRSRAYARHVVNQPSLGIPPRIDAEGLCPKKASGEVLSFRNMPLCPRYLCLDLGKSFGDRGHAGSLRWGAPPKATLSFTSPAPTPPGATRMSHSRPVTPDLELVNACKRAKGAVVLGQNRIIKADVVRS